MIQPMHDRILVKYLDDPEHLHSRVIAVLKVDPTLLHQAGKDPVGEAGDYRRVMRRSEVVAVGPRVDAAIRPSIVVYCAAWDDLEGKIAGHALIREADIALIEKLKERKDA